MKYLSCFYFILFFKVINFMILKSIGVVWRKKRVFLLSYAHLDPLIKHQKNINMLSKGVVRLKSYINITC